MDPPPQSHTYPFYVTTSNGGTCAWNEVGGTHLPNIRNAFGGGAHTEYGPLLDQRYPTAGPGTVEQVFDAFHRNLTTNPCPA